MKRRHAVTAVIVFVCPFAMSRVVAETYYLDARKGDDRNNGTMARPVRTFARAAKLFQQDERGGPTTLKVAGGVYVLHDPVLFESNRPYSKKNRLCIEAEALPGEAGWTAENMPVVLSTHAPDQDGEKPPEEPVATSGLKIELSHVSIRGLKFLGNPVAGLWYYPIFREGKTLEDLVVSQCLFMMDPHGCASNVGVLANGHGLVVDHCVFHNCRNPVVFWLAEGGISRGNAMRYCVVDGAFTSAVWVCDTAEDFDFHHNVITRAKFVWMRNDDNRRTYRLHDCVITDYEEFSGQSSPEFKLGPTDPRTTFEKKNVIESGVVALESGDGVDLPLPARYFQVVSGTLGSDLGAGLFLGSVAPNDKESKEE